MAASAGSLVVSLGLNAAEYIRGLTKAEQQAEHFSKSVQKSAKESSEFLTNAFKGAIAGLSVGLVLTGVKGLIDDATHAAAALDDMAESTGSTVESLSALQEVARISGQDFDAVGKGLIKLAQTMNESRDSSSGAAFALKQLGLTAVDANGNLKSTGDFTLEIAKKFATFKDGTEKTAAAISLYKKAGAELLPFLKDLAETGTLVTTTTTAQAAAAEEYEKNLKRLATAKGELVRQISFALVPAFNSLFKALEETNGGIGGLQTSVKALTTEGTFKSWAQSIAIDVAEARDSIAQLSESLGIMGKGLTGLGVMAKGALQLRPGSFVEGLNSMATGYTGVAEAAKAALDQMKNANNEERLAVKLRAKFAQENAEGFVVPDVTKPDKPPAPNTSKPSVVTNRDDPARKILEGQLKAFERTIKDEQDMLKDREHFLQVYYQDDKIGIQQYYATRQGLIDDALAVEVAALDGEIAALQAHQKALPKANLKDRADDENKIAEAIDKRAAAQKKAATAGIDLWLEEAKAAKQFISSINQVTLTLMQMRGQDVEAAGFGFDLQNAQLREKIELEKQSSDIRTRDAANLGDKQLTEMRERIVAQAALNEETRKYSLALAVNSNAQARIDLARSSGAITEIESLNQISAANKALIPILQMEADAYAVLVAAMGKGPAKDAALQTLDDMRLRIEQLGTQTNLLADKFTKVFADSFNDAFLSVIDGTSSVKDAFKSMEKSLVASINKIAAQELTDKLFGKSGAAGGIGDFFAKLFSGSSGSGSFLGGMFAAGGSPPVGKLSLVGEGGPELFVPKVAGTIIPNDSFGKSVSNVFNINVPQNTNRASASQIARETAAAVTRATRRDG